MLSERILEEIEENAEERTLPDGDAYRSLSARRVAHIAKEAGTAGRFVEVAALRAGIVPERYARNFKLYSFEDQARLLESGVAVVGLGGLGGTVVDILAREGVGRLTLIDGDRFEESNLNRQLLSRRDTLGVSKAAAASSRVSEVNGSVEATPHSVFLTEENAGELLFGADVVIDCLDNLPDRFVLERTAKGLGIPLVSAAIAGVSGHVTTVFPEDAGLALIYGPPDEIPRQGAEASAGCIAHAITLLSATECSEAVKILLGADESALLRNRLFVVDMRDNTFEVMALV